MVDTISSNYKAKHARYKNPIHKINTAIILFARCNLEEVSVHLMSLCLQIFSLLPYIYFPLIRYLIEVKKKGKDCHMAAAEMTKIWFSTILFFIAVCYQNFVQSQIVIEFHTICKIVSAVYAQVLYPPSRSAIPMFVLE